MLRQSRTFASLFDVAFQYIHLTHRVKRSPLPHTHDESRNKQEQSKKSGERKLLRSCRARTHTRTHACTRAHTYTDDKTPEPRNTTSNAMMKQSESLGYSRQY